MPVFHAMIEAIQSADPASSLGEIIEAHRGQGYFVDMVEKANAMLASREFTRPSNG